MTAGLPRRPVKSFAGRRIAGPILAVALAALAALALLTGSAAAGSSLTLSRTSGPVQPQPVLVTYVGPLDSTGICDPGADFTWDGVDLGTVKGGTNLGAACRYQATFDLPPAGHDALGVHTVEAVECSNLSECDREGRAEATYTVEATATPTPSTTPTLTSNPSPTGTPASTSKPRRPPSHDVRLIPAASPSAPPSPSISPSALPSPTASATPTPTPQPTPSPTAPVPTPSPTRAAAAVARLPRSPNNWLAPLVSDVPGPSGVSLAPGVVATNALLALFFMLLFALTAEILNNTLDDHREVIGGWVDHLGDRWILFCRAAGLEARFDGLATRGRSGAAAHLAGVLLLLGLVYGFLSPQFGPNGAGFVLVLSVMVGLGVLLYTNYGLKALLVRRAYCTPAGVRTYGLAIIVAAVCVSFSRLLDFHPGIVYGFVASLAILAPLEFSRRDQARLVVLGSLAVLVVGLVAFVLLGLLRTGTGQGDAFLPSFVESVLVILYIGSLEGLTVNLLPITYLDGAKLYAWSRLRWAVGYSIVLFLWWQLLFNRDHQYADAFRQSSVLAVMALLTFFTLTTIVIWAAFRVRDRRREGAETPHLQAEPELSERQSATVEAG